jgi:hypothetical protein
MKYLSLFVVTILCLSLSPQVNSASLSTNPDSIPFAPAVNYPAGNLTISVFCANLDGDLDLDLAVVNYGSDNVSIFLNYGNGTFQPKVDYSAGSHPQSVCCADLDGDLDLDFAVANGSEVGGSDDVYIFLNNGDGTFQLDSIYAVGDNPRFVCSADLDHDSDEDLVVTNELSNSFSILMNNGDGTFQPRVDYGTGTWPRSVCCGDLDSDGDLDLAVTNRADNDISIFLNDGNGNFPSRVDYPAVDGPYGICCTYLDQDSSLDLALVNDNADCVSIFLNDGNGDFPYRVDYPVGDMPRFLCCGDLDGDSDVDLAVANQADDDVSILRNNGDGTFRPMVDYNAGDGPFSIVCADLDGDSDLDLATANSGGSVSVLINQSTCFLMVLTDTICLSPTHMRCTLFLTNQNTIAAMTIPLHYETHCPGFTVDSATFWGTRIENWEQKIANINADTVALFLTANIGGGTPPLPPGEGSIAYIYFSIPCDPANVYDTCFIAWDTTTVQPEDQGLLFVDNHANEFVPYFEPGTTSVVLYRPGDVNCNCKINSADIVALVNYLFGDGPEPCPLDAGDVNGDCDINAADIIYLINYLFIFGPPPVCGCVSHPELAGDCAGCDGSLGLRRTAGPAEVEFVSCAISKEGKKLVEIDAKFAAEVAGVQLELGYSPEEIQSIIPELADRTKDLNLFFSAKNGILKIGIFDLTGRHMIPAGEGALVKLSIAGSNPTSLEIQKAILVDKHAQSFEVTILPKEENQATPPQDFTLFQNYPNPFNPATSIQFTVGSGQLPVPTTLNIYNIRGQLVRTLVDEQKSSGTYEVIWDGKDNLGNEVASGVYFYKLQAGDYTETKKMILMK